MPERNDAGKDDSCMLSYYDELKHVCAAGISVSALDEPSLLEAALNVEHALIAIDEGVNDQTVLSMATSFTKSMFFEMLESIKGALIEFCNRILSTLNNFIMNDAKIADKYRAVIKSRLNSSMVAITQRTYEYPDSSSYPRTIKASGAPEKAVQKLQAMITSPEPPEPYEVETEVDYQIMDFSRDVIDGVVDLMDIKGSTASIVQSHIRGADVLIRIDAKTVDKYLDQIKSYAKDKAEITKTRKAIIDDYERLRKIYSSVTADAEALSGTHMQKMTSPVTRQMIAADTNRFSSIHIQMMRLFNTYIQIYQVAFDTKLQELQNKIENNKNTIAEILTRTGLFAAVNTKNPDRYRKPIEYNPTPGHKTYTPPEPKGSLKPKDEK